MRIWATLAGDPELRRADANCRRAATGDGEWDVSWLGNNSGWLNGTAFPTYSGNSVLTGHVTKCGWHPWPFAHLNGCVGGDQVIVHAWGSTVYNIRGPFRMVLTPEAVSVVITHTDLPWVTLITVVVTMSQQFHTTTVLQLGQCFAVK